MSSVASVKDRLKNYAKKSGRTVQDVFTVYILERILYRISVSKYVDNFTLKGGILLYGLYTKDFTRATTDIDLLGGNITNDKDTLKTVFKEILSIVTDDPIRFDLDAIEVINITEFKKYHGVKVTTTAYLDRTRIPVGIDIGFGDVIYPERVKMEYNTMGKLPRTEHWICFPRYSLYRFSTLKSIRIIPEITIDKIAVFMSSYKKLFHQ